MTCRMQEVARGELATIDVGWSLQAIRVRDHHGCTCVSAAGVHLRSKRSSCGSGDIPVRQYAGIGRPVVPGICDANGLSAAFRRAAQKALPAVVVIKASPSPVCPRCGRAHESSDGEAAEGRIDGTSPRSLEVLGSGFIVAPSGIVLTNKHVVRGNDRLVVQTVDGRQFTVEHVTTDPEQDAAVLHIEADTPLPSISLGDSDSMQIGDWVLTIGCPLELDQTVSAGIISAKDRSFCTHHQARYLQTDAVVNPGSSGGPLVDLNGMAVGVATAPGIRGRWLSGHRLCDPGKSCEATRRRCGGIASQRSRFTQVAEGRLGCDKGQVSFH